MSRPNPESTHNPLQKTKSRFSLIDIISNILENFKEAATKIFGKNEPIDKNKIEKTSETHEGSITRTPEGITFDQDALTQFSKNKPIDKNKTEETPKAHEGSITKTPKGITLDQAALTQISKNKAKKDEEKVKKTAEKAKKTAEKYKKKFGKHATSISEGGNFSGGSGFSPEALIKINKNNTQKSTNNVKQNSKGFGDIISGESLSLSSKNNKKSERTPKNSNTSVKPRQNGQSI